MLFKQYFAFMLWGHSIQDMSALNPGGATAYTIK